MSKIKSTKITVLQHQTTDGNTFNNIDEAEFHQSRIDIALELQNSDSELNFKTVSDDLDVSDIGLLIRIANILKANNQVK